MSLPNFFEVPYKNCCFKRGTQFYISKPVFKVCTTAYAEKNAHKTFRGSWWSGTNCDVLSQFLQKTSSLKIISNNQIMSTLAACVASGSCVAELICLHGVSLWYLSVNMTVGFSFAPIVRAKRQAGWGGGQRGSEGEKEKDCTENKTTPHLFCVFSSCDIFYSDTHSNWNEMLVWRWYDCVQDAFRYIFPKKSRSAAASLDTCRRRATNGSSVLLLPLNMDMKVFPNIYAVLKQPVWPAW